MTFGKFITDHLSIYTSIQQLLESKEEYSNAPDDQYKQEKAKMKKEIRRAKKKK